MPRPPSTAANSPSPGAVPATPAAAAWDELAGVLDEIASLARDEPDDDLFYRRLLAGCTTALSAEGGAVWAADETGRLRRRGVLTGGQPIDDRPAHEAVLRRALAERAAQFTPAHDNAGPLAVAPIVSDPAAPPAALVEVQLRGGASPSAYAAATRFLEAVCEIAGDRQLRSDLGRLRAEHEEHRRLAELGRRVQGEIDLERTCHRIANETRDAVDCDRVSVVAFDEARPRLVAVSGVDRVDRRSTAARGVERLSRVVHRLREPIYLLDKNSLSDAHDDPAEADAHDALHRYADESHARQVLAMPLFGPLDEPGPSPADRGEEPPLVGVLVADQFTSGGSELARQRLAEAADLCAPALATAISIDRLPLLGLSRALSFLRLPRNLRHVVTATAVAAVVAAALVFTPAELMIDSPGQLQPEVQRQVFAPGDGLVEAIHAGHGDRVAAGALLLELRDPELDLELKKIDGELETTRRQLDATRAARTSLDRRDLPPVDALRLSSEEQQLELRLSSLAKQRDLLEQRRAELSIVSPAAGTVLSWRVEQELVGRPVQRGQALLTIADTESDWRVELRTPDDRIGHVLSAQQAADEPLRVEYRLASEETGFSTGVVREIAQRADEDQDPDSEGRAVLVVVAPDDPRQPAADPDGLRPGQSVRARIHCGSRSLGYVWLHDVWHTLKTWWEF